MRNRKFILVLSLLLYSTAAVRAQDTGPKVMNLEECLEYAYEHNETYLIAGLERKKQDAYVGEVLAEGLPQINGTVDFRKNLIIRRAFIPSDFSDPNSEMIAIPFGP